jgi:plasmid maintenance system antidote protein VapI
MKKAPKRQSKSRKATTRRESTAQPLAGRGRENAERVQSASVNHEGPSEAKTGLIRAAEAKPIRIPPGKLLRAQGLLLQGESQRQVARTLHVSRTTASKIIKSADFQNFITESREKLFGIVPEALESFRAAVEVDGYLAYRFLTDLGVRPDREAMLALANATPSTNREDQGGLRQAVMLAACMLESERVYGTELPDDIKARLKRMENGV